MALRPSVGAYWPAGSPLHRTDPRAKVAACLIYMASCLAIGDLATAALAMAALGAAARASHAPVRRLLSQLRPLVVFMATTVLVNLLLTRTGPVLLEVGPVGIRAGGVRSALVYSCRMLLMVGAGALLTLTTPPAHIVAALESLLTPLARLGLPAQGIAPVLSIALRFVSILADEAHAIASAQTARGADLDGTGPIRRAQSLVPLVVPVFSSALRRADRLGRAMDARCFTGGTRGSYRIFRLEAKKDAPLIAGTCVYLLALALASIL